MQQQLQFIATVVNSPPAICYTTYFNAEVDRWSTNAVNIHCSLVTSKTGLYFCYSVKLAHPNTTCVVCVSLEFACGKVACAVLL